MRSWHTLPDLSALLERMVPSMGQSILIPRTHEPNPSTQTARRGSSRCLGARDATGSFYPKPGGMAKEEKKRGGVQKQLHPHDFTPISGTASPALRKRPISPSQSDPLIGLKHRDTRQRWNTWRHTRFYDIRPFRKKKQTSENGQK